MTFKNLHVDTDCECLNDECFEDTTSYFGIKTNKSQIREVDFKSKFDKAKEHDAPLDFSDCNDTCSHKGLSCSLIADEEKKLEIIEIYNQLFPSSPKYRPYLNIFRIGADSGLMKSTPQNTNKYHHDFYKCDTFTLKSIEIKETISLADNV